MKKVKLDDDMEVDNVSSTPSTAASLEMRVVGVVRHKLLFKNRPKAIISSESPFSLLEYVGMVVRTPFLKEQNFVSTETSVQVIQDGSKFFCFWILFLVF